MNKNFKLLIFLIFSYQTLIFSMSQDTKIFFSSIPKTGTHMLMKLITMITNKKGYGAPHLNFDDSNFLKGIDFKEYFLLWHVPFTPESENNLKNNNFKCFFMYRDPRDQIISYILFNLKYLGSQIPISQKRKAFLLDLDDLIVLCINNVKSFYDCYTPWLKSPLFYSVKFEDLIGENGGGSKKRQISIIQDICKHLGLNVNQDLVTQYSENLFGGTNTFREGQIGSWRKYFKPEHKEYFKKVAGQLLIDLGYEKDMNW